ncbi:MAG: hypothetical protein J0L58_00755 [Burkholderiales bacterium]|nr:hypothetical protein [Burkholderiales bacterium]
MPEASDVSVLTSADVQTGALLWVCPELGHDLPPVQIEQRWRRIADALKEALPDAPWRQALPAAVSAPDADALLSVARRLLMGWQVHTPVHMGLHLVRDTENPQASELRAAERAARRAPLGAVGLSADLADRLSRTWELPLVDLGHDASDPLKVLALPLEGASGQPDPVALRDVLVVLRPQIGGNDPARAAACADLIADTLTGSLARSALLRVVARESTSRLTDSARAVQDAFTLLGASHVMLGKGHLGDSGTLLLNLEVLAKGQSRALWSDRISVRLDDLLAGSADGLMRAIADAHAALMSETLSVAQLPAWQSLEDHQLLIGASQLMHRLSPASFERSRLLLEGLRERAPNQALVHAWTAKWHVMAALQGLQRRREAVAEAVICCQRALEADPYCAMAMALQGYLHIMEGHPPSEARAALARALDANPSDAFAWLFSALQATFDDRLDEAHDSLKVALALSPLDPWRYLFDAVAAHVHLARGDIPQGLAFAERSARQRARHAPNLFYLTIAHARSGNLHVAHEHLLQLRELWPQYNLKLFWDTYGGRKTAHATDFAWALTAAGLPER